MWFKKRLRLNKAVAVHFPRFGEPLKNFLLQNGPHPSVAVFFKESLPTVIWLIVLDNLLEFLMIMKREGDITFKTS